MIKINSGNEMWARLAAIGCNEQEISRAYLAAVGCNGLTTLSGPFNGQNLKMNIPCMQFSRARDHEIINEGTECVQSEIMLQLSHYHRLADEPTAA